VPWRTRGRRDRPDGTHRTGKELADVVGGAGLPSTGFGLGYLLMHAGARRPHMQRAGARKAAHVRAAGNARAVVVQPHARRHRAGVGLAGDRLRHDLVDGVSYWSGWHETAVLAPPTVHLVQGYDEYVVAFAESKYVLDVSGTARALPPGTAVPNGVLLLDGQVAGRWRRTSTKDTLLIEAMHYRALAPAESEALDAAAAQLTRRRRGHSLLPLLTRGLSLMGGAPISISRSDISGRCQASRHHRSRSPVPATPPALPVPD
jgi:hypothetical protein